MDIAQKTILIKQEAARLGFFVSGVAKAGFMDEEARRLESWLNLGYQGNMAYLGNHFDKRVDPTKLVPGAKSVISLAYNYFTPERQQDAEAPKLSMYAYGKDYHKVVRKKLNSLFDWMISNFGAIEGRCFVDSAPVLERDWAKRSGVGWIGKNTMLIHPRKGSYFFLAEIISDLDLLPDAHIQDYCGTCTRCIDACPTDAISPSGYIMDGSRCISYLTIELKERIPQEFKGSIENWMYGCDICQTVCPWNRFSTPHHEPSFNPGNELLTMTKEQWQDLTEDTYNRIFEGSAVKRAKYEGLKRNISFIS